MMSCVICLHFVKSGEGLPASSIYLLTCMLVETKVDYSKPVNLILTTVVLVIGLSRATLKLGHFELKGMALATIAAILLSLFFKLLDICKLSNE
jgi:uracil permease